jgi:chromosome segregation ATPase
LELEQRKLNLDKLISEHENNIENLRKEIDFKSKELDAREEDINKKESSIDFEIELRNKKLDQSFRDKLKASELEIQNKLEELEESYREKLSELSENSNVNLEALNDIKTRLSSTLVSLPYYQNKMDVLKRILEEIVEGFDDL